MPVAAASPHRLAEYHPATMTANPDPTQRATGSASPSRLCIDVSNTLETGTLSGVQRVTLELAAALSSVAGVVLLDGRTGRLLLVNATQRRHIQRLSDGHSGRTITQRLTAKARRSLADLPAPLVERTRGRPAYSFKAGAVLLDLEASWHAPVRRSELLPLPDSASAALIHDILPITNPEWFPAESTARFRSWFDAHVSANSTLLAVSHASADAVAATGVPRPSVIRIGHADGPLRASDLAFASSGVLMVGTIEPRKGHAIVLDALDLLGAAAPVVDVVGRPGWDTTALASRLDRHPKVRWHRDLDDAGLEELWSLTGLLLQPSLGEGFGLPVIEALRRGVAVASSDIPVMREVGRGQTTLLPHDASAWADVLATFANGAISVDRPDQLTWPTWSDSATDTLAALSAAGVWPDQPAPSQ